MAENKRLLTNLEILELLAPTMPLYLVRELRQNAEDLCIFAAEHLAVRNAQDAKTHKATLLECAEDLEIIIAATLIWRTKEYVVGRLRLLLAQWQEEAPYAS